ncbi:MAG: hypothetical protein Q9218_007716, partial [Villophora microphyllina]
LLNEVQTNVAYFERRTRGDDKTYFRRWDDTNWLRDQADLGEGVLQRHAEYPNDVPQAAGIPDADYTASGNTLGYMFKRNFTFGLATPLSHDDGGAWSSDPSFAAKSWELKDGGFPEGTDGQDVLEIACAVNTFGQDDIFDSRTFNGLCRNGEPLEPKGRGGFGDAALDNIPNSFSSCVVEFGSGGASKRSLGKFHEWDILSKSSSDYPTQGFLLTKLGVRMTDHVKIPIE